MKILFVAATTFELEALKKALGESGGQRSYHYFVAGIGMVSTAYHLTKHLADNKYQLIINVGIAGSFRRSIPIGSVVEIESDCFSDLGAEDGNNFLSLSEMKLQSENEFPFRNHRVYGNASLETRLRKVSGITVNTVHGDEKSIGEIVDRLQPDVESMEGAAFLYVCNMENLPCIQIRAISNYVEKRDTSKWKINEALQKLSSEIKKIVELL